MTDNNDKAPTLADMPPPTPFPIDYRREGREPTVREMHDMMQSAVRSVAADQAPLADG